MPLKIDQWLSFTPLWEYVLLSALPFNYSVWKMMTIWWCLCVSTWQAKLNEQREQAKQVAKFNLHVSENRKTTNCPLLPVSSWTGICSWIKMFWQHFFPELYMYVCVLLTHIWWPGSCPLWWHFALSLHFLLLFFFLKIHIICMCLSLTQMWCIKKHFSPDQSHQST